MPKIWVMLVAMNLADIVVREKSLPSCQVTSKRHLEQCVQALIKEIGIISNLAGPQLVNVGTAQTDGSIVICYRVRTRSRALAPGFSWSSVNDVVLKTDENTLLYVALDSEQT